MDPNISKVQVTAAGTELSPAAADLYRELGVSNPMAPQAAGDVTAQAAVEETAGQLAMLSIFDIGVFFAVLLVGFAYVWKRGDLDWVRALTQERTQPPRREPESEMALSA